MNSKYKWGRCLHSVQLTSVHLTTCPLSNPYPSVATAAAAMAHFTLYFMTSPSDSIMIDHYTYYICAHVCVCERVSVCMARGRKHVISYCANIFLLVHMPSCSNLPCRLCRLMPNIERLWMLLPQAETMSQWSFTLTQDPLSSKSAQRRLYTAAVDLWTAVRRQ